MSLLPVAYGALGLYISGHSNLEILDISDGNARSIGWNVLLRDISLPQLRKASITAIENHQDPADCVAADRCTDFYERHPLLQDVFLNVDGPPCHGLSNTTLLPQLERFVGTLPNCLSILYKPKRPTHLELLWIPEFDELYGSSNIVLARPQEISLTQLHLDCMFFVVSDISI